MATMTLTKDYDENLKEVFFVDNKKISEEEFYAIKRNSTCDVAHIPEQRAGTNPNSIYGWRHHYIVTGAPYQENDNA